MGTAKPFQIKVLNHPEVIFIFLGFIILFQFPTTTSTKTKHTSENLSIPHTVQGLENAKRSANI